jgi:hypothetical protein
VPLQKWHTKFIFQVTQAPRDGRLRHALRSRSAADAVGIGDSNQVAQVMKFHK